MKNILFFSIIGTLIYFIVSCKDNVPTNPSNTDTTSKDTTANDTTSDPTGPKIYYFTPEKGVHNLEVKVYGKNFIKNYTELKLGEINCWDYKRETLHDTDIIYIIIPEKAVTSKFTVFAGGKKATSAKAFDVKSADSVVINNYQSFYSGCPGSIVRLTGKNLTYINNLEIFWYGVDVPGVKTKIISINDNYIEIETPDKSGTYTLGFKYLRKQDLIRRERTYEAAYILIGTPEYKGSSRNFASPGEKIGFGVNFLGNNPEIYFNGKKGVISDYMGTGYYWIWNQSTGYSEYKLANGYIVTTIPTDAELPILFKGSCGETLASDFKILKNNILPAELNNIIITIENIAFDYYSYVSYMPNDTSRGTTNLNKTFYQSYVINEYDTSKKIATCYVNYSQDNASGKTTVKGTYKFSLGVNTGLTVNYEEYVFTNGNNANTRNVTINFKLTGLTKILDDPTVMKKTVYEATGSSIVLLDYYYYYNSVKIYDNIETKTVSTGFPAIQPDNARVTITINYK